MRQENTSLLKDGQLLNLGAWIVETAQNGHEVTLINIANAAVRGSVVNAVNIWGLLILIRCH